MSALLTQLETTLVSTRQRRDSLLNSSTAATFTPDVEAEVRQLNADITDLTARTKELREQAEREARVAAASPVGASAASSRARIYVGSESIYRPDGEHSFFKDIAAARSGVSDAIERLDRNNRESILDYRALSTSAAAGGTFAPPAWLVDEYVKLARPGRVTADRVRRDVLPQGVSSLNFPKVSTGTTVGVTQTQNTAVSNTDITTTSVSSGITTIAGQQVVSLQLLYQSAVPFDQVILEDLALAYSTQVDVQVLSGSGADGQLRGLIGAAGATVTFTTTTPAFVSTTAAASFYNKVVAAKNTVETTRYLAPDTILMHPRRWNWALQALDGQQRPQIAPNGQTYNQAAVSGEPVAQGYAGNLAGLPVYVDPNIPTNVGAATNEDVVIVCRSQDLWLYETDPMFGTFDATYANQNSVLFRVVAFSGFIPDRYPASTAVVSGTGLTPPATL